MYVLNLDFKGNLECGELGESKGSSRDVIQGKDKGKMSRRLFSAK